MHQPLCAPQTYTMSYVDWVPPLQWCLTLCNPMDCSPPSSAVHQIPRQEWWSGLLSPSPEDLPNSGIKPVSLMSSALAGGFFTVSTTWEAYILIISQFYFISFFKDVDHFLLVSMEFVTVLLLLYVLVFHPQSMWNLNSLTRHWKVKS